MRHATVICSNITDNIQTFQLDKELQVRVQPDDDTYLIQSGSRHLSLAKSGKSLPCLVSL